MTTVAKPGLGSIAARLERLPQSRWHVKVRFLIGAVTFFEAFDQLLSASALPVLMKDWHLSTGQATFAITAGSVGMLLGALVAGWMGDRVGRVRTVALGVAVTALASLAVAFSNNIEMFSLFRFVQGLGIGGVVPVAATYINEIARSDKRGRFVLLYEMIFPLGLAAATLVAVWVVPTFGWRAMFVIGALPVLLAVALPKKVVESPRWLLSQGRTEEAEQVIARIEAEVAAATGAELPEPAEARAEDTARGRLRELFTGRYLRRTTVLSGLWFVAYYVNHGISTWLPSLYTKHFGLDLTTALEYTLLSNVTGLLGTFAVALVIDRVGGAPPSWQHSSAAHSPSRRSPWSARPRAVRSRSSPPARRSSSTPSTRACTCTRPSCTRRATAPRAPRSAACGTASASSWARSQSARSSAGAAA